MRTSIKQRNGVTGLAKDIETYLEELEDISKKLSGGDLKLAEAVELYKQGEQTARKAEKLLQGFEKEIEVIGREESETEDE